MNFKMMNGFFIWVSVVFAAGLSLALSFYLFALIVPLILIALGCYSIYMLYMFIMTKNKIKANKNEDVIDIEYEVIDSEENE